jgi:RNA polymerase sigma factor (sigma-70 family)
MGFPWPAGPPLAQDAETAMQPLKQDTTDALEETLGARIDDLYRQHGSWLRSALRRRFGGSVAEIADDLVQETYLRLMPIQLARSIERPRALLMRIASNLARDHFRRSKVFGKVLDVEIARSRPRASAHQSAEPFAALELSEAILSLPEPQRDVFVLSRFAGLTYDEIADHLGLPVKTVEWRMGKALALCSERLRGEKA